MSQQHKLPLNVERCSHISMSNSTHHFSFSGTLIEKVHIQKDLGVYITSDLKWDNHTKMCASKVLGVLFMLKTSSPRLTPSAKLNLYKSNSRFVIRKCLLVCYCNKHKSTRKCSEKEFEIDQQHEQ